MTTTTEETSLQAEQGPLLQERVAQRAHELFLARGGEEGRDLDDWLQAEAELTGRQHASA